MLLESSENFTRPQKGKIGIFGRMLNKKNPVDPIAKQIIYLMNNPQKVIDSTFTDNLGKFSFNNQPAGPAYLVKIKNPAPENYTEMVMVNDEGQAIMSASSKTMDSKGVFRFEKLPAIIPEKMKTISAEDERMDLSAISSLKDVAENQIIVMNNIYFALNEAKLMEKSFKELDKLAEIMTQTPSLKIEISGHTDNLGNEQANKTLSENRAKAVSEYLITKKVDKSRLFHKGYGSSKPIVPNDSDENRQKNRRVEFKIVK